MRKTAKRAMMTTSTQKVRRMDKILPMDTTRPRAMRISCIQKWQMTVESCSAGKPMSGQWVAR